MRASPFLIVFLVAAVAGCFFASFSTYDFVEHLDRQVHGIHCSFIPGLTGTDASGSSGCHLTMMSPYSSIFRSSMWGGIPVSLGAMSVFAYLLYRGLDVLLNNRLREHGTTLYLVAAAALPLLTSLVMGYLSIVELGAACKLCIGIYSSSLGVFIGAMGMWRQSLQPETDSFDDSPIEPVEGQGMGGHISSFALGIVFVAIPGIAYSAMMPDYSRFVGSCGDLPKPEDTNQIMVSLDSNTKGIPTIEVFDPLCPACKSFEGRLDASGLGEQLHRQAVMFPLDASCNWMVGTTMHAGACTISEAVLCAREGKANAVIDWAFEHQEEVRSASEKDPKAAAQMVTAAFPELKACVGSAKVQQKLGKALRWAVANRIPVLTPQIYVRNKKLCDEDTDLGMDYALSGLIAQQEKSP
jgi:uncharacterized membrane protein